MHVDSDPLHRLDASEHRHASLAFASVALFLLAVIALFAPTARSMVAIWSASDTFAHGFLVLPASLWFIWDRRARLVWAPLQPFWPGLVVVAAAGFVWLLSDLSDAAAAAHFALVAVAVSGVITVFGLAWARILAFPLGFLIFAVPFGEAFVPALIDWTAKFVESALKFTGVPVLREGDDLTIPTGRWSVVQGCSGLRYLISSVMSGVLYAWIMYRSPLRRAAFVLASIAVPIVANWLRAYLIVLIGHLSENRIAAGIDHFIYGWVFFGMVAGSMFWIGARWRENLPEATSRRYELSAPLPRLAASKLAPATAAVTAVVLVAPLVHAALTSALPSHRPVLQLPIGATAGWAAVGAATIDWRPTLQNPRAVQMQSFERGGRRVTLYLGLYRDQQQGVEMVNSTNRLIGPAAQQWQQLSRFRQELNGGGRSFDADGAVLRAGATQLLVLHWYWTPTLSTSSDVRAKVDLGLARLAQRDDFSAWVAIATERDDSGDTHNETLVLREFVAQMGGQIDSALRATAAR